MPEAGFVNQMGLCQKRRNDAICRITVRWSFDRVFLRQESGLRDRARPSLYAQLIA